MASSEPLLQANQLLSQAQIYWWPFCRMLALLSMAPLFNHKTLSVRIRVLLALAVTLALAKALPTPANIDPLSLPGVLATMEQLLLGVILGLMLQLVFTIFTLVGEIISTQMGMSMARYNDPTNGVSSSSIIYQLYFILLVLLYLASDGHLLVISVFYQSFVFWPVGTGLYSLSLQAVVAGIGWMFSAALLVALPIIFVLILVQFCFGLLNRIAPALNLFSLGFPITILVGLLCILITLPRMPQQYLFLTHELLDTLARVLKESGHV